MANDMVGSTDDDDDDEINSGDFIEPGKLFTCQGTKTFCVYKLHFCVCLPIGSLVGLSLPKKLLVICSIIVSCTCFSKLMIT